MEPESKTYRDEKNKSLGPEGEGSESSEKDTNQRGVIRTALTSASFIEKVVLLLLTAILTGIVVPSIINDSNRKYSERQKEVEKMRARDDAILQAQSKLLDDVSEIILTCETLILDVSWYRTRFAMNEEMHRRAFSRYSERIVDLISRWRALQARARNLTSPVISSKIDDFLRRFFLEQDTPLNQLYGRNATDEEWERLHQKNEQMLVEANNLISEIGLDLGLSKNDLNREVR
jgi:hypothetical protein